MGSFLSNYEEVAAVILFVIGMSNLLLQPNLMKKIIGLDVMDGAVYLFLAAKGLYRRKNSADLFGWYSGSRTLY